MHGAQKKKPSALSDRLICRVSLSSDKQLNSQRKIFSHAKDYAILHCDKQRDLA
jgi:hypothetical protein